MTAPALTAPPPAGRARWTRLIPVAIVVYIISFMDRTNIGFALSGLHKDLHIDAAQQGLAAGIFFIGYLTLQVTGATWRSAGAPRSSSGSWSWSGASSR